MPLAARFLLLLAPVCLVPAAHPAPSATPLPEAAPADVRVSAAGLEKLHALLRDSVARGDHAGFATILARNGRIADWWLHGVADVTTGAPLRRDTIFRIYSMTKIVTSVAVLILVEEGKLGLDDPLAKHLPALADRQVLVGGTEDAPVLAPAARPITLRQMLSHTAGFGDDGRGDDVLVRIYKRQDLWNSPSLAEFVTRAARLPLRAQPGTEFNYSIATDLLGAVVERASGLPFEEFLRRRIFVPLQMDDTFFDVPEGKRPRIAGLSRHGPDGRRIPAEPVRSVNPEPGRGFPSGGSGLFSTAGDYLRFAQMLANGGELDGARILKAETVTRMTTVNELAALAKPTHAYSDKHGWGLGVEIELPPAPGGFGWAGAATTYVRICPRERTVMLLFAQHLPFNEHGIFVPFVAAARAALEP